jgi:hypothetical protein
MLHMPHNTGVIVYQGEMSCNEFRYKRNDQLVRLTQKNMKPAYVSVYDLFMTESSLEEGFDITETLDVERRRSYRRVFGEMEFPDGPCDDMEKFEYDNDEDLSVASTFCPFARVQEGIIKFDMGMICMSCNMSFALYTHKYDTYFN